MEIPKSPRDKPHIAALKRAIEIAGSQAKLADGISRFLDRPSFKQQTVSYWLTNETLIEAEYWPAFESITNGEVTGAALRPDVFGRAGHSAVRAQA